MTTRAGQAEDDEAEVAAEAAGLAEYGKTDLVANPAGGFAASWLELDEDSLLAAVVAAQGGSDRPAQREMVRAVAYAINEGHNLAVQAGTGVGKSLGYLVPLSLYCLQTGRRGLVATATLALQRQILNKDAPAVLAAIGRLTGKTLVVAPLKGWSNYLCLHNLEHGWELFDRQKSLFEADVGETSLESPSGSAELSSDSSPGVTGSPGVSLETLPGTADLDSSAEPASPQSESKKSARRSGRPAITEEKLQQIRVWAGETETGDRDDLPFPVDDLTWRSVSTSTRECLSSRCPFAAECFPRAARDRAGRADLVVTNHALLAIEVAQNQEVLPEFAVAVVDEAHQLASNVRRQATVTVTVNGILRAGRLVGRLDPAGADDLGIASGALEAALAQSPLGLLGQRSAALVDAMAVLDQAVRAAQAGLTAAQSANTGNNRVRDEVQLARAALDELTDVLNAWDLPAAQTITWVSENADTASRALNIAPLDVPTILAGGLLDRQATVLTSATLTPGGNFKAFKTEVGLGISKRASTEIDVGTPFDFQRQGCLYVAEDLPAPGRSGLDQSAYQRLVDLTVASGGGTLGLFTSYEAAKQAASCLREATDLNVLLQGEDALPALLREFLEDPDSCLVGTRSLWEGVDVPGKACRLVVIDRIPFARPDDPVAQALDRAAKAQGRSGFMEASLNPAAVALAQGVGRLIRSATDMGVVAILDSRLVRKNYGNYLVASLPQMRKTTNLAAVVDALHRLRERDF